MVKTRILALILSLVIIPAWTALAQTALNVKPGRRAQTVTLEGCLQPGYDRNEFILEKTGVSRNKSSRARNEMAQDETSYALIPEGNTDLIAHAGHKVEITGVPTGTRSSAENSRMNKIPELRVSSIRHLASSCP